MIGLSNSNSASFECAIHTWILATLMPLAAVESILFLLGYLNFGIRWILKQFQENTKEGDVKSRYSAASKTFLVSF